MKPGRANRRGRPRDAKASAGEGGEHQCGSGGDGSELLGTAISAECMVPTTSCRRGSRRCVYGANGAASDELSGVDYLPVLPTGAVRFAGLPAGAGLFPL